MLPAWVPAAQLPATKKIWALSLGRPSALIQALSFILFFKHPPATVHQIFKLPSFHDAIVYASMARKSPTRHGQQAHRSPKSLQEARSSNICILFRAFKLVHSPAAHQLFPPALFFFGHQNSITHFQQAKSIYTFFSS
jgi:hypothetical protein